ncbi:MBL fold metallo-hydrolase [Alicyclobacillus sp. SO9]|uniref:MBL fold metallo-hydrolase n=1 Tax=Alicyclobacillus sp. SO9 TaxID=2665646 RepID=UPI0018E708C3|nr:MBL fold metallo-hydrolase [Alicyclobacillus sp. SO9]QQE76933.1 MBL fold metallo-hydrolase [Alicyclobacillus sp. SO9]
MRECQQLSKVTVHRIEQPTPFPVGTVNSYILRDESEVVVFDCGPRTNEAKQTLLDGLAKEGVAVEDVTALVLSHGHVDHVGLTSMFQSKGVPVFSHPEVDSWLHPKGDWDAFRERFFQQLYRRMGMPDSQITYAASEFALFAKWNDEAVINQTLRHGDLFTPLPNFRVVEVPGHAQAAIALYDESTGEMFAGDQVLPLISSNALIEPRTDEFGYEHGLWTKSLLDYRANLQQLLQMPISKIYPGHGPVFEDVQDLIKLRLVQQERRRTKMLQLLKEHQPCSAYELAAHYFAHRHDQPSLILSETLGYLDWLEALGEVFHYDDANGTILWEAK